MPVTVSQNIIDEVSRKLNKACENGDNISAIADRANVRRQIVSHLRNGSYESCPTIDKIEAIFEQWVAESLWLMK